MNVEEFWASFDRSGECWIWTKGFHSAGYGAARVNGRTWNAHRLAWELTNGPIPPGMGVLHRCDTPACANPEHLFLGTQGDNLRDMFAKGRSPIGSRRSASRLTDEVVFEVRRRFAAGERQSDLARAFDVSPATIHRVVHNQGWTHLLKETA